MTIYLTSYFLFNYLTKEVKIDKDLLYSSGNYIQYLAITIIGNHLKKYITESLSYKPETNTIL